MTGLLLERIGLEWDRRNGSFREWRDRVQALKTILSPLSKRKEKKISILCFGVCSCICCEHNTFSPGDWIDEYIWQHLLELEFQEVYISDSTSTCRFQPHSSVPGDSWELGLSRNFLGPMGGGVGLQPWHATAVNRSRIGSGDYPLWEGKMCYWEVLLAFILLSSTFLPGLTCNLKSLQY